MLWGRGRGNGKREGREGEGIIEKRDGKWGGEGEG
jgi:hypothetical protein